MRALLAPTLLVLAVAAPAQAGPRTKHATVTVGSNGGGGGTDAYRATVLKKLERSYLTGIKSCYRTALKKRPDLAGKLMIAFIVNKRGAATPVSAAFDVSLDPCVLKAVKGWKFGVPKDSAKAAVDATFTVELALTPPAPDESVAMHLDLLTAENTEGMGDLSNRRPGVDLEAQLGDVKDGSKRVGVGTGGGYGQIGIADERPQGAKDVKGPAGRITFSDTQAFDASTLTVDLVLRKVQTAYTAGLKRCYKLRLAVDATLRGKMKLALTVNETGRTVGGTARGFDPEIDTCMTGMMKNWIFAIPKDRDGEPTEATFGMTLTLVPD